MTSRRLLPIVVSAVLASGAVPLAQGPEPARAIALAEGWRTVVLMHLEESRAYITGDVVEQMDPFFSTAAVMAVRDKASAPTLKKAEEDVKRLAQLLVRSGTKGADGSVDVGSAAWVAAHAAFCPLSPFCLP